MTRAATSRAASTTAASRSRPAIDQVARVARALADPTRLRILALLGDREVCVCHIHESLGLPQPTVSRHLAFLRREGLVDARRDGVWMHYQVASSLAPPIQRLVTAAIDALAPAPAATRDRREFQRAFGRLYVVEGPSGRTCCAPRAPEDA